MAYSADATRAVLGAFISAITSDLRRRARKRKLRGRLQTGSLLGKGKMALEMPMHRALAQKWRRLSAVPTKL